MNGRNGLYLLFLIYFATIPGWSVVESNAVSPARTSFEGIKAYIETLNTRGKKSGNYSLLSVDNKYNHLLVGAKDNAFLVDLENIHKFKSWNLTSPATGATNCDKSQNPSCQYFVKIMLPFEERIFICLTAGCTWRNRTNLNAAPGRDTNGNVFTSDENYFSRPDQNDTAVVTERGTVFRGTINPSSRSPMIYSKSFKQPELFPVFTSFMDKSDFFSDVHFVKSFDIGKYVYFFFRELELECESCGKLKVSRVARICKGDYAGKAGLKKYFVTFQKAKLSCSDGGDYPVTFNEIQDVWWDAETNLFHGVFTTHPNGPPSSAICVYNLTDVNKVFDDSSFKSKKADKWVTVENKYKEYFKGCKVNPKYINPWNKDVVPDGMMATKKMLFNVYQDLAHDAVMEDAVKPASFRAWFIKDGIRMTSIAIDKVGPHVVVYTSTDRGSVLKISQPAGTHHSCFLTEINVFPTNKREVIKAMTIDLTRHVLYLGSDTALTKLRLEQCSSHIHHRSCISASDPYCAWNKETRRCVSVISHRDSSKLRQDLQACPKVTDDITWSSWKTCVQGDGNLCRCQVRPCQNRRNSSCEGGYEFRLENCTVDMSVGWEGREAWETYGVQHGNWSAWGTWTECSAKAWVGVTHRTRTCTDPVPRRGGRPCVGQDVQYKSCSLGLDEMEKRMLTKPTRPLNPSGNKGIQFEVMCKATGYKISHISVEIFNKTFDCEKQRDLCGEGEWSAWSEWGQCSVESFQIRRRACKAEPCVGERLQERPCEPTPPDFCKGDDSWDVWSVCECKHGLNLPEGSGVRSRIRKCREECPSAVKCSDTVEYETCNCKTGATSGRRQDLESSEGSCYKIGHVIGTAVFVFVVTVVLCCIAMYFFKRRQQQKKFNVSNATENNSHDTSSDKYSTIARENGVSSRGSSSSSRRKDRNPKTRTCSPLNVFNSFRKHRSSPPEDV